MQQKQMSQWHMMKKKNLIENKYSSWKCTLFKLQFNESCFVTDLQYIYNYLYLQTKILIIRTPPFL